MTGERAQRRIERLLDEADQAADREDWGAVRAAVRNILAFDPENRDAQAYLSAAERATVKEEPSSFVNGRYAVKRFLGEGGKKRVYLAHDTLLDRDVAFALIKTEGLDAEGRQRITREAQAMGRLGTRGGFRVRGQPDRAAATGPRRTIREVAWASQGPAPRWGGDRGRAHGVVAE